MTNRIFDNNQVLPQEIVCSRGLAIDPLAVITIYDAAILGPGGLPTGQVHHYVSVQSEIMTDAQIEGFLADAATAAELSDLADARGARINFLNMPNWATWSVAQAQSYINTSIFNGQTQAQVDTYIDATATNLAGARTVMHQMAAAMINIRTILSALAQAVIYIRQLIVRFGF